MNQIKLHGIVRRLWLYLLCTFLAIGILLICALASGSASGNTVSFVNSDMTELTQGYPTESVPDGAMLYTKENIQKLLPDTPVQEGCSWYLYRAPKNGQTAYGPVAIPDPVENRTGYEFYDWAALGTVNDADLHTVQGETTFIARYARSGQYLVNLYFQYDDDTRSVAAPTISFACGLDDPITMSLPTLRALEGMEPAISCLYEDESAEGVTEAKQAAAELNAMLQNGKFSATLDEDFLKLCRTAWFVEWDMDTHNYQKDANGVVQINIPVVYAFNGTASFQVHYYQQGAEDPRSYEAVEADFITAQVTGSTHVNLEEMGLVKSYDGFTLNPISQQYAASYTVSPNGSTVIDLHYDRELYYVTYQLLGGNLQEPVAFRYGQALPTGEEAAEGLLATPVRPGYEFTGWTYKSSDGTVLEGLPITMPAYDLVLEANWEPAETTVTITYWLENANDDDYTPVASREIGVQTEDAVGYSDIAAYLEPTAQGMEAAGIDDGEYFSLVNTGDKAIPTVIAAGDRSSTINAYYDRREYTLVFHVGWISDGTNNTTSGWYYISAGGNSNAENDPDDWTSGYSDWKPGAKDVTLTMGGRTYPISNKTDDCYQITAKYGAFIGDQWPVAGEQTVTSVTSSSTTYNLFTWGTHAASPYFQNRVESNTNKNIMGVYSTMSAELIINPDDPAVVHHLTAYWSSNNVGYNGSNKGSAKIHHYLFEAVPGTVDENTVLSYGRDYQGTVISAECPSTAQDIASIQFYEYQNLIVRTTHDSANQNPPAFANLTFQYGCYNGADVYFFYTYDDYTLTYDENNPDLTGSRAENHETVHFHYIDGKPLKDTLVEQTFTCDYTPAQPYICQYGNAHIFAGWYKDPACTIPINWETVSSESSVTAYAKWNSPTFDLTLEVPSGSLPESTLQDIMNKGYSVDWKDYGNTRCYTIHNVTDGTPINQVLSQNDAPVNLYGLAFQYWYETDTDGLTHRFLFDDSQVMNADRTLTAQWIAEDSGVYVVQALTAQDPGNGKGTVELEGTTYYRLEDDRIVSKIAMGSTITLEPQIIGGYLPIHGSLTQIVTGTEGNPTVFAFVYAPIGNQSVTYTVHYVLDTGEDYGRTEASDAVTLSDSTTVTLTASAARSRSFSNQITGIVRAKANIITGYVPRNGYLAQMPLAIREDENHLYFYYVSNGNIETELGLDSGTTYTCKVQYYVWNNDEYSLVPDATQNLNVPANSVLYARDYAQQYIAASEKSHLQMDQTHTVSSLVVPEGESSTLSIFLRDFESESPATDSDWSQPTEELPEPDETYTPIAPPDAGNEEGQEEEKPAPTPTPTPDSGGTPLRYTLHYASNGGTPYPDEQYSPRTIVSLDKVPLREGYRFTGWYADEALTQPVNTITMTGNRTVYAGWRQSTVPELLNGADHFAYVIGYEDGTVQPLAHITRAEVASIFFRLLEQDVRETNLTDSNPFTDISGDEWYHLAVSTLNALGIFQGRTATWFDGSAPITRAEFAAVCARFDSGSAPDTNSFTDTTGHWAQEEIQRAASLGWILGYEDGTFRPDQPITRAEAMTMINRVLNRLPETPDDLLADMTLWPDNPPDAWYYLAVQEATNTHDYLPKGELYETWTQLLENPDWTQYQ